MRKHSFLFSIVLSLVMVVGLAPAVSAATSGNSIWCGLWSGSNFNTSGTCPPAGPTPPSTPNPRVNKYAALGDSVAAGVGLPSNDLQCGRSAQGYPNIVAHSLNVPLINASCSGATVGDLFTKQRVSGPNIPAQLDTAFATGTPKLITITAGANDAHWADFIRACYATTCGSSSYSYTAQAYISAMKVKLHYALTDIRVRSGGHPPQVIITGYYNALSDACTNASLTTAELAWLNSELRILNNAIQRVSSNYSFVKFVPVNFSGHDMCSTSPWVQGPNDRAPFHPTATGQQVIARSILDSTRE
jgi:lysophospholipase L1-like esterase